MIWMLFKHQSVKPTKYTRITKQLQETFCEDSHVAEEIE